MTEPKCFKIVKKEIWEQEVFVTALNKKAALELARAGHYEILNDPENAIIREKQIKSGSREKKTKLIESMNPKWIDLYDNL